MAKPTKYGYDDITLVPEAITDISTRHLCNPYDENGMLPIFASPMSAVINEHNIRDFVANKINVIVPRSISNLHERMKLGKQYDSFVALSLAEAEAEIARYNNRNFTIFEYGKSYKICIDIANGHMGKLFDVCRDLKKLEGVSITLMAGNIANPKSYKYYESAGVDYIRCGVGGGSACTTASNTGNYYPYFSFLEETYAEKVRLDGHCKIIADGGIRGYGDIQKALIYADYVMIGGIFNQMLESAGKTLYGRRYFVFRKFKIFRPFATLLTYGREIKRKKFPKIWKLIHSGKLVVKKEMYGMSTKKAQKEIDPSKKTKTAEGRIFYQNVQYTIANWVENETDYLRSSMSYQNARTLEEYKDSEYVVNAGYYYNR